MSSVTNRTDTPRVRMVTKGISVHRFVIICIVLVLSLTARSLIADTETPYAVRTLAGGFVNGSGVAVDTVGNLYVTDHGNATVSKVSPAGMVTTLAGRAGN